ncbi:MAG: hypothetical protein HY000_16745 [Planctomycetes bacterium]|nr:hypothetical protein [Planctomycetia bacterium]MBI3464682.1 hypothetical protein [Planctomycetota bacterium]
MNAAMSLFLASTVLVAQPPDEFFGKRETLPVSGPIIGKSLPYDLGAVQASGKREMGSLSSNLE